MPHNMTPEYGVFFNEFCQDYVAQADAFHSFKWLPRLEGQSKNLRNFEPSKQLSDIRNNLRSWGLLHTDPMSNFITEVNRLNYKKQENQMKYVLMISHSQNEFAYHIRSGDHRTNGAPHNFTPVYPGQDLSEFKERTFNSFDFTPGFHDSSFIKSVLEIVTIDPKWKHTPKNPKFWMVFVEGERSPVYQHMSEVNARYEAGRLGTLTNKRVYVLEAIATTKAGIKVDFTS